MFATIWLPKFYLQAATRHQPELRDEAIAVLDGEATKAVLLEINDKAERAGVGAGMAPSQGLARCLSLIIKARALTQEQCLTDLLLEHAFSLAPFVEATGRGTCVVQFTDWRRVTEKAHDVVERLARLDVIARVGIATNADTSLLAAHAATPVLLVETALEFLAPLPIETLAVG